MTGITTSIHLSMLFGNKIKPTDERCGLWLLLENLHNNNLVSDIGNIIYTDGEERMEGGLRQSITEPFCDNIMVAKICDQSDCETQGKGVKQFIVKKDICGAFNSYLRTKFSTYVSARHGVKAKLPFLLDGETRMAKGLASIIKKDGLTEIRKKYKNPVVIPYKIELAEVRLSTLLETLPDMLKQLEGELYYLLDLDITQDFAGIFNKTEMIQYLTKHHNFCFEGENKKGYNVILDNSKTVGNDCLTWLSANGRIKIYNKFVCQMTSPGVNKAIGNHIIDFIHCPDERLKETFSSSLAQKHGITRLEATIYNYVTSTCENDALVPIEDCTSVLENSKMYLVDAPFYSVPIVKMWTKLTKALQNSCCLVFNDILQYVYWGNGNTKKLTGVQLKLPKEEDKREKLINYALSAFSFHLLPINYLEVTPEGEDKIKVSLQCYNKQGGTYFTRSTTAFSTIPEHISISDMGLVDTTNVQPRILTSRTNINKLRPYPIEKISALREPFVTSGRKRQLELEEIASKRRKMEYAEKTKAVREEYARYLEKEEQIRETQEEMTHYFEQKWEDLDTNASYDIYAFSIKKIGPL